MAGQTAIDRSYLAGNPVAVLIILVLVVRGGWCSQRTVDVGHGIARSGSGSDVGRHGGGGGILRPEQGTPVTSAALWVGRRETAGAVGREGGRDEHA